MVLLNLEHTQVDGQLGTLDNYDHFFTDDDMATFFSAIICPSDRLRALYTIEN